MKALTPTVVALLLALNGCQILAPRAIDSPVRYFNDSLIDADTSQIEVGKRRVVLDTVGWVIGAHSKLLFWDLRVDNHRITEPTIEAAAAYLEASNLPHVKVRMNQYAPLQDFKRLRHNTTVGWPYRYSLGVLSVASEAVLPGRLLGGDHFNPYTQTVHLYSDVPAIALHELAHAKDFSRRHYQGTYALAYSFAPLWHETIASREVFDYLFREGDVDSIREANRILYPAHMTYVGGALGEYFPAASAPVYYTGVLLGHLNGRWQTRMIDEQLARYQTEMTAP
ncbi:MAG: hypothetical protein ACO1RT_06405 [Planctomycetaceae bacterium]